MARQPAVQVGAQEQAGGGLEIDAVVEAGDERWAAFEMGLGESLADEDVAKLLRLAERVDSDRMGEPSALGVIVSSGWGYTRKDGVSVIPIGALGP